MIGARSLSEVTEGLVSIAADAKAKPLRQATVDLINGYLGIEARAEEVTDKVRKLLDRPEDRVDAALAAYERRLGFLKDSGVDMSDVAFSGEFGRNFAYYTGFVFEVVTPSLGPASPVAGGGRYDGLLEAVGAGCKVPAVGGAIHTERLLAAVRGGRS